MKSFTDIFIHRPVFATVLSLILLLVGIRAYLALPVRNFPKIDASVITIQVEYPGANASLMESQVASQIEDSISGVEGLDYVTSSSTQGTATITAYFRLGYDIDTAFSDISAHVASVRQLLPKDIQDPVIQKEDPNAIPVMFLSFTSNTMSPEQISDYLNRAVKPKLQTLPGVGSADIQGLQYAMRIWLNPQQMAAHEITPADVQNAIEVGNLQAPAGRIEAQQQEFNVDAKTDLVTAQQFNDLVIKASNNHLIRMRDIGHAELGPETNRVSIVMNGKPAVLIFITTKSAANPLDVAKELNKEFAQIKAELPPGLNGNIILDTTQFISASIDEVHRTIIEAAIFVILIIFLFLGSVRTLIIPAISIPLSLIGVCGIMLAMGYSLNTLTLLAMVLAIGMVVDDAIVVSENIHRHIAEGKTPLEASLIGASEIKFAVVAMTLTLAAVYAPIGFMTGLTGALFREFSFTLAAAVIVSGFIALTLSPMMCSRMMTTDILSGKFPRFVDSLSEKLRRAYAIILDKVLKARTIVIICLVVIVGSCYFLYTSLPSELAPKEDIGWVMTMGQAPAAANLDYTQKYSQSLVKLFSNTPAIINYGIVNGYPAINSVFSFASLAPWGQRPPLDQIITEINQKLYFVPGLQIFAMNPFALPGSGHAQPIQLVLQTTGSYETLNETMQQLMLAAYQNPGIVAMSIQSDLKIDKPQLDVKINRSKAGDMGIPMANIGQAISLALNEAYVTHFTMDGRSYQVIPELSSQFRDQPTDIDLLNLRTASGQLVPLSNLVNITETVQPQSLNHFQQMRSATLSATLMPGYTLGQALTYLETAAKKIMPANVQLNFAGQSRQFIEASGKMLYTFLFALIFIFLVLAAQFESFRDPLIVMLSVPLSTIGALAGIHIFGGTMNIYTEIGLVTLIGLISKHGILMVEFANQLQEQGASIREAIVQAASIRLRPILMTTLSMILGSLPLALATGSGAISRRQLGLVIICGMAVGTLFTLFVIPTIYTYLATKITTKDSTPAASSAVDQ